MGLTQLFQAPAEAHPPLNLSRAALQQALYDQHFCRIWWKCSRCKASGRIEMRLLATIGDRKERLFLAHASKAAAKKADCRGTLYLRIVAIGDKLYNPARAARHVGWGEPSTEFPGSDAGGSHETAGGSKRSQS